MNCGNDRYNDLVQRESRIMSAVTDNLYKDMYLYTAYLGRVKLSVSYTSDVDNVKLECKSGRNNDIVTRVIDSQKSRINFDTRPLLRSMVNTPAAIVNIAENKETYFQIQQMELQKSKMYNSIDGFNKHTKALDLMKKHNENEYNELLTKFPTVTYNKDKLHKLYVKNICVDIHFNTQMFLIFSRDVFKRDSINSGKFLVSLYNNPELDNAFFTGEYMVYGNGDKMFYPLGAIDVSAHELTHGMVHSTAGLKYVGHSGALNESFADVVGISFEFWLYNRFNNDDDKDNDLNGEADWLCGEDIGKTIKYLRNLRDPTKAKYPQPKKYGGKHWANPNKEDAKHDYGGVHINSGVPNKCFYLLSKDIGLYKALSIFYSCLLKLDSSSDFIDFRDTLVECAPESLKSKTQSCLDQVGLTRLAVSDWMQSPIENRVPNNRPRPKSPNNRPKPRPKSPNNRPKPRPKSPNNRPRPRPRPRSPEHHKDNLPYPNPHIPYQRFKCCPHCLCLQKNKTNIDSYRHDRHDRDSRNKRRRH